MLSKIKQFPCKILLAVTIACLVLGESYPFSNFPMFGSFNGRTYYVYLADQTGQPIPAMSFGVPTNGIKKKYDAGLRRAKSASEKGKVTDDQDHAAAEQTLHYLIDNTRKPPAKVTALQLVRVDITLERGNLVRKTRVAAQVPLP